jgi:hypothetical protein
MTVSPVYDQSPPGESSLFSRLEIVAQVVGEALELQPGCISPEEQENKRLKQLLLESEESNAHLTEKVKKLRHKRGDLKRKYRETKRKYRETKLKYKETKLRCKETAFKLKHVRRMDRRAFAAIEAMLERRIFEETLQFRRTKRVNK